MDDKQKKACVDYINEHAAMLHGGGKVDIGDPITVDNIIDARIDGANAVLIVDRGIKGSPKYTLDLSEVEGKKAPKKSVEAVEAEARKVDAVQSRK